MSGLRALSIGELLELKPPPWLIDGILPQLGLLAVYGIPGDGKTFAVLDMALSVAAGVPWHGHPAVKGCVVYISAEGGGGIGKRVGAWLDAHNITPADYPSIDAHFIVSTISVHPESDDLRAILEMTAAAEDRVHELENYLDAEEARPPLLVIVDTLARCFIGDENQQEDMGAFVRALDTLREDHQATVLVVHHTNAGGERERGNTSFRGACDTMIQVSKKDSELTLKCTKQKDAEPFKKLALELTVSEKWQSCYVTTPTEDRQAEVDLVRAYLEEHPCATVRTVSTDLGLTTTTAFRRMRKVRDSGL